MYVRTMQFAQKIAKGGCENKISAVFIDVSRKSNPNLSDLANLMNAHYINLPRANARDLSESLKMSLEKA